MKKRFPKIDLIKLIGTSSYNDWNRYLKECEDNYNVFSLISTYYGLQIGLQHAIYEKIFSIYTQEAFMRFQTSIRKTLARMYRSKFKKPCIDPLIAPEFRDMCWKRKANDYLFDRYFPGARIKEKI